MPTSDGSWAYHVEGEVRNSSAPLLLVPLEMLAAQVPCSHHLPILAAEHDVHLGIMVRPRMLVSSLQDSMYVSYRLLVVVAKMQMGR